MFFRNIKNSLNIIFLLFHLLMHLLYRLSALKAMDYTTLKHTHIDSSSVLDNMDGALGGV